MTTSDSTLNIGKSISSSGNSTRTPGDRILTTEGTRFLMYFTEGNQASFPPTWLSIYISTQSRTGATVTVTSPAWVDASSINLTLQVTLDTPQSLSLPASLRSAEIGRESKALLVEATEPISVFGLNPSQNQAALFAVLPTSALDREYIFPSYTQFNIPSQGFIGVVTEHDQTSLEVHLPQSTGPDMASIRGIPYSPGQTIKGTLNRFEVSEIRQNVKCPECDLSGARIVASKPVAVFSTISLNSPLSTQGGDILVEQLVPVSSWGKTYLAITSPKDAYGTIVRVMSGDHNVTVYLSNMTSFFLSEPGDYRDIYLASGTHMMLQGNNRLQVIQYSSLAPFMLIVTSMEHFSHRAHIPIIAIETTSNLSPLYKLVVITRVCDVPNILVNTTAIKDLTTWRDIATSGFAVAEIPIPQPSFHLLQAAPGSQVTFGGYIYGQGEITAYAAPLAMEGNKLVETFSWAD